MTPPRNGLRPLPPRGGDASGPAKPDPRRLPALIRPAATGFARHSAKD